VTFHPNSRLFKLPLLRNYDGIALGRHMYFKGIPNRELIAHEMVHQRQMDRHGVLGFYVIYLTHYLLFLALYRNHTQAYRAIPFEKEAYGDSYVDE
jgi:hypothetical protein